MTPEDFRRKHRTAWSDFLHAPIGIDLMAVLTASQPAQDALRMPDELICSQGSVLTARQKGYDQLRALLKRLASDERAEEIVSDYSTSPTE